MHWFQVLGSVILDYVNDSIVPEFADPAKKKTATEMLEQIVDTAIAKSVCINIVMDLKNSGKTGREAFSLIQEEYSKPDEKELYDAMFLVVGPKDLSPGAIENTLNKVEQAILSIECYHPNSSALAIDMCLASIGSDALMYYLSENKIEITLNRFHKQVTDVIQAVQARGVSL